MNWTEAFHSTQPTELHTPTTPWKKPHDQNLTVFDMPRCRKKHKEQSLLALPKAITRGTCLFMNITAKMKAKFFYTKELEYQMLSIPLNHLELFNHNSNASEISLTNCYLLIAKVFFSSQIS